MRPFFPAKPVGVSRYGDGRVTLAPDAVVGLSCGNCTHEWSKPRAAVLPDGYNAGLATCPSCGFTNATHESTTLGGDVTVRVERPDRMPCCSRCGTLADVWPERALARALRLRAHPTDPAVCFACYSFATELDRLHGALGYADTVEGILAEAAVLDFETTGLRSRAVVEVGLVVPSGPHGGPPVRYGSLVNPGPGVTWEEGLPHGLTPEALALAPAWAAVHAEVGRLLLNAGTRTVLSWSYFEAAVLFFEQDRVGGPITRKVGVWPGVEGLLDAVAIYQRLSFAEYAQRPGTAHPRIGLAKASEAHGHTAIEHRALSDAMRVSTVLRAAGRALRERVADWPVARRHAREAFVEAFDRGNVEEVARTPVWCQGPRRGEFAGEMFPGFVTSIVEEGYAVVRPVRPFGNEGLPTYFDPDTITPMLPVEQLALAQRTLFTRATLAPDAP